MKKLIAFSIVFAILSGAVFAADEAEETSYVPITITGGATATFIPFGIVDPADTTITTDTETLLPVAGLGKADGDRDAGIELQLNVAGALENGKAGFLFQWRPHYSGGFGFTSYIGDNAELWFKPLDWIRIDAGKFVNNSIRGRLGNGAWFGDFTIPRPGEGDIFANFDAKMGMMLSVTPEAVDGLGVYVLVNSMTTLFSRTRPTPTSSPALTSDGALTWTAARRAEYVYENTQAAVSYALPNIGLARVQYVGADPSATIRKNEDRYLPTSYWGISAPKFEAAFAYTGMTGLTVDVGGKIYLPFDDVGYPHENVLGSNTEKAAAATDESNYGWGSYISPQGKYQAPFVAALGVKYELDPLTLSLLVDGKFAGYGESPNGNKLELGPEIRGWLTANYKLNDTFTAQAEGGVVYAGETKYKQSGADARTVGSDALLYGFGAGLQTTFGTDCTIRVGATFTSGNGMGVDSSGNAKSKALPIASSFSVPVIMSVAF
jgi:hypothetical protein